MVTLANIQCIQCAPALGDRLPWFITYVWHPVLLPTSALLDALEMQRGRTMEREPNGLRCSLLFFGIGYVPIISMTLFLKSFFKNNYSVTVSGYSWLFTALVRPRMVRIFRPPPSGGKNRFQRFQGGWGRKSIPHSNSSFVRLPLYSWYCPVKLLLFLTPSRRSNDIEGHFTCIFSSDQLGSFQPTKPIFSESDVPIPSMEVQCRMVELGWFQPKGHWSSS